MGRVEKFRNIRAVRQKYFITAGIFILLLAAGMYTADYSISKLIGYDGGLGIFHVFNSGSSFELVFMNQKLNFDLTYVNSDIEKVRKFLAAIFD